jgi:hypothetical protein
MSRTFVRGPAGLLTRSSDLAATESETRPDAADRRAASTVRLSVVLHWVLRLGMAGCFIGHGAFGIIGKEAWLPYLGFFGIPPELAWDLMPVIGTMDIALGIVILLRPMPVVMLHLSVWGFMTAMLRPLTGESVWELFERGGNYAVPLAFLFLTGFAGWQVKPWLARATNPRLTAANAGRVAWSLRIGTAALLVGHGAFGALLHKAVWYDYLAALGISESTATSLHLLSVVGWFEIALGLAVLVAPLPGLLLFVLLWKLGTELLRPLAGEPLWEFIERAGSYAAPLGLYLVLTWMKTARTDAR